MGGRGGTAVGALLALAGCAGPGGAGGMPRDLPAPADAGIPLAAKAALLEEGIGRLHLLPWGALAYRVVLPGEEGGAPRAVYVSDQCAWTGALLGAEAERWAATGEEGALARVRTLLDGLTTLSAVTGERGFYARFAGPRGFLRNEPFPHRWADGGPGYEGWRWRGDASKDQVAGILYGLAAVTDLVEDGPCRARAARLLGDLSDRLLGRGMAWEDGAGAETTFGDVNPRVAGLPVGVNAAIALGLADAAAVATGEPRHARRLEALVGSGACEALRYPTVRLLGKEGYSNANMCAMALASVLRRREAPGRFRSGAEEALRRILDLHRGEGNAFWIAVAAPAGIATRGDLDDARWNLRRYSLDRRDRRVDLSGLDLPRAGWEAKGGGKQFTRPLPLDLRGANSFAWKSNPYAVVPEAEGDERTVYAGTDFLAAYWPLRRLGVVP